MKTAIRKMENSYGSIIPKPLLAEVEPKQLDAITAIYVDVVFGHVAMALSKKS